MTQDPIKQLSDDHRYILMVVNYLAALAPEVTEDDKPIDAELLRRIVSFMREFADHCHHAKEEDLLFPMLVEVDVPESGCPIAGLKGEHVKGRNLVGKLGEGIELLSSDEKQARALIGGAIDGIVKLYPNHIWKEDEMVFPMASRILDPQRLEQLATGFDEVEEKHRKCHAHHTAFAESLKPRLTEGTV